MKTETRKKLEQFSDKVPTGIWVEVDMGWTRPSTKMGEYENAAQAIKRHIDGVTQVVIESKWVCRFCGLDPEVDEKGPCCCGKAIEAWEQPHED